MKQNSIRPMIKELERVYDLVAKKSGLDKIAKRPLITVQSRGSKKLILGWHWNKKWKKGNKEISEINICAEALKDNPVETLIHEVVHYHNSSLDIKDCNSQQYHNKSFKTRAESYGLNCKKDGRHGYAYTDLSDELKKELGKYKINEKLFKLYRQSNTTLKLPTKMKKWTCGCTTVRCATDLNAKCLNCERGFVKDE